MNNATSIINYFKKSLLAKAFYSFTEFLDNSRKARNVIFISTIAAILIAFLLGCVLVKGQGRTNIDQDQLYFTTVSVSEGDSLWSIAREYIDYDHYDSINDYMDELRKFNKLTTDKIYSGSSLIVILYNHAE